MEKWHRMFCKIDTLVVDIDQALFFAFQLLTKAYEDELRAYEARERFELAELKAKAKEIVRGSRRE